MRTLLTTLLVGLLASAALAAPGVGTLLKQPGPPGAPLPAANPSANPASSATGTPASVAVATVNGQPILREQIDAVLREAFGKQMLQQLVALEVVKQAAAQKKLVVTEADIRAEEGESFPDELRNIAPKDRDRLLDEYLTRNGLTRTHWRLAIERNAYLRRLASNVPEPTDAQLRELFERTYGAKVQVRHMQLDSAGEARKAQERLKKEKFEDVTSDMSTDKKGAATGGLMQPFDIHEAAIPEEIRNVAFNLAKEGDVSDPVTVRGHYHLLQLVKRIQPADKKFEDVKPQLAKQVHDQLVRVQMNYLLRTLPAAAQIEILDPVIRKQAEQAREDEPALTTSPAKSK